MRVVIQRVNRAQVDIDGKRYSGIDHGLCIFLGIEQDANDQDLPWLVNKIANLRIFSDDEGKMNLSVMDVDGGVLLVSQFTLHASTKKGNRPSFIHAENPEKAQVLYEECIRQLEQKLGKSIESGEFGGDMKINLENDGPVTILIDTEYKW